MTGQQEQTEHAAVEPEVDDATEQEIAAARPLAAHIRAELLLYGAIAAGSVIGSLLRWLVGLGFQAITDGSFPWGTLFVNATGSFVIGLYAALTGPGGRVFSGPRTRQFVMTGICGGYTTFSMFTFETLKLARSGAIGVAGLYVGASVLAWLAAAWIGEALANRFSRLEGA